jgi:hypothetical protein
MKFRRFFAALLVTIGVGAGFLAGRVSADQPHMQAALEHLRTAKAELQLADRDKGGHRENAVRLVNDAIVQVEKGINFDRRH